MGVVYLTEVATQGGGTELCVVKRLLPELARREDFRTMFLEEARLQARLVHPHVVHTRDVGFDGQSYYLEMEYLEGQSFDALLRSPKLPRRVALHVVAAVLGGLHAAHELTDEQGHPLSVVHRDLSPHNVMVTYDGGVKVLDFGIAKASDSSIRTQTGAVKGKLTYMAPEQTFRRDVDRRADVFAVGVALWEALAGARFWGDVPDEEIYARLRASDVTPVSPPKDDVPASLLAVCRRAIAFDREERFPTAAAMREALIACADAAGETGTSAEVSAFVSAAFSAEREGTRAHVAAVRAGRRIADELTVPVLDLSQTRPAPASQSTTVPRSKRSRFGWIAAPIALVGALAVGWRTLRPREESPAAKAPAGCVSNAACIDAHGGEAFVCRQGRCVALASEDCRVLAEPSAVRDDATLWVGAMFPLTGPDAAKFGEASLNAVDLARQDFQMVSQGLPPGRDGGRSRPIGVLGCDDAADPKRAAKHLADDVGVPAVIGFHRSNEALELAQSVFFPRGTLMLASLNTTALLTAVPGPAGSPRLLFRTAFSTAQSAPAFAAIVAELLEPSLQSVLRGEPMRVAMVRANSSVGHTLASALVASLRWNGKSVVENGRAFRDVTYAVGATDYAPVVRELVDFRPHVVALVTDQLTDEVIAPLERAWPKSLGFRPRYVLGNTFEGDELFRFLGKDAERRRRFLSITPPTATPTNAKFTMRYNEVFSPKVIMATSPASPYDAFYLAAYAAVAAGDGPLDGASLARAIPRLLPPGDPIDVGSPGIFAAAAALRAGKNIDLAGAYSPLDFDVATGESSADFSVLCVGASRDGTATESVESGVAYDARRKKLRGTLRCD
jgi:serine/threonine-protein kinase